MQQELFLQYLVGLFRWDDVQITKPVEVLHEGPRRHRDQGKHRDVLKTIFGPFDLAVYGPDEIDDRTPVPKKGQEPPRFPCGQILLTSPRGEVSGPLDPSTWARVAEHIKENATEERVNNGWPTSGSDWGR